MYCETLLSSTFCNFISQARHIPHRFTENPQHKSEKQDVTGTSSVEIKWTIYDFTKHAGLVTLKRRNGVGSRVPLLEERLKCQQRQDQAIQNC